MFSPLILLASTAALLFMSFQPTLAFSRHGKPLEATRCDLSVEECGEEVCITDYLANDDMAGAREAIRVEGVFPDGVESFAGFASVNETAKNKLFFWYVPALNGDANAPLLIWLQGGPGGSSLFGMFSEMGPYSVAADGSTLIPRESTWNRDYGMIFIDNPVGAGYSYTETETGYCTNTKGQVSSQLFELMQQFYQVFPEQLQNNLIITGESYAGHYVPGLAFKIFEENNKGVATHIPLTALAVGDGWIDPYTQLGAYPDMLFNIGVASEGEKLVFRDYVTRTQKLIELEQMADAFNVWDEMINGDIYPYPNYYHNVTGSNDYDNFMDTNEPADLNYYFPFVTAPNTRKGIHAGAAVYNDGSLCEHNLVSDFMVSFKDEMSVLMDNYKVLIYSGQLDVIIGAALTEAMMPTIPWSGRAEFLAQEKSVWRVDPSDSEVAGYVKQWANVTQAVVRGAGHLVPFDQPERALDMLQKWIKNEPFVSLIDPVH